MSSQTTTTPHGPRHRPEGAAVGQQGRNLHASAPARKSAPHHHPRNPCPATPPPACRNHAPHTGPHRPHHHPHTQHHGVSRSCHPALSHASSRRLPHRRRTAIRKRRCRGNHPIVQSHNRDDNDGTTVRSHEKGDATLRLIRTDHLERAPPKAGIRCDQAFSNYDSQEVFRLHAGV